MKPIPYALSCVILAATVLTGSCSRQGLNPLTPALTPSPGGGGSKPAGVQIARSDEPRIPSPASGPENQKALAEGNAAFAFDLYRTLSGQDGNLFYSPYSISIALAMTYAGAAGETASQMGSAMHITLSQADLHAAFNAYSQELEARAKASQQGTPFELSIANSLWGQKDFTFRKEFLDLLAENYGSGMRLVDFASEPEPARLAINQWVSDETHERIKDLIPSGAIDPLTRLVLANAIYFKAGWLHTFADSATASEPFHLLDGSTATVPMMHQSDTFAYAQMGNYRAIELPYQTGDLSMLVILPDEGQFKPVEATLDARMAQQITDKLMQGPVILALPKFTYDSSFSLNAALESLGMSDAFDPARADFSGMDNSRDLYITNVLHKAFVSVDEKGTEAAAATAVIIGLTSAPALPPIEFKVDRPFIYLIHDSQTGSILFVGRVLSPAK